MTTKHHQQYMTSIPQFIRDRCIIIGNHRTRIDSFWRAYKTWLSSCRAITDIGGLARKDFINILSNDFGYTTIRVKSNIFVIGLRISRMHIMPRIQGDTTTDSTGNRLFQRYGATNKPRKRNIPSDDTIGSFLLDDLKGTRIFIHSGDLEEDIRNSIESIRKVKELARLRNKI